MSEVLEMEVATGAVDIDYTGGETVIISSPVVHVPRPTVRAVVEAWAHVAFGGTTTAVRGRIRRGTTVAGQLVGEFWDETGEANEFHVVSALAVERREGVENVQYSLTCEQAGGGSSDALLYSIKVTIL